MNISEAVTKVSRVLKKNPVCSFQAVMILILTDLADTHPPTQSHEAWALEHLELIKILLCLWTSIQKTFYKRRPKAVEEMKCITLCQIAHDRFYTISQPNVFFYP